MKLTIIGGGSVRTPNLIPSLIQRAESFGLREVWLMDIQEEKLNIIGGLCQMMVAEHGNPFKIVFSTSAQEAITDADHVITSIRPAYEQGRATDERICFEHGVLGQETTGAAGFAMAMRSAPAILEYARMIERLAKPTAWLFNFTNPAGLVAQILHDAGIQRVIGICDSANTVRHVTSRYLNIPENRIQHRVYGLNHLSWTRNVFIDADPDGNNGEEVLAGLLHDETFIAGTNQGMFAEGLREWQASFMNEYLHYYYHRDEVLETLRNKEESRGEEVLRLTTALLTQMKAAHSPQERMEIYHQLMGQRRQTYMAHAQNENLPQKVEEEKGNEGYAGVALGCVAAMVTGEAQYIGLNVPNKGAINGMRADDIVEVACWVNQASVEPIHIGAIPEHQLQLMQSIKHYERLASQAILQKSRPLAIQALAVHPLVGSYPLAEKLVSAFIETHSEWVGEWL